MNSHAYAASVPIKESNDVVRLARRPIVASPTSAIQLHRLKLSSHAHSKTRMNRALLLAADVAFGG
jgi:hypothetical protein